MAYITIFPAKRLNTITWKPVCYTLVSSREVTSVQHMYAYCRTTVTKYSTNQGQYILRFNQSIKTTIFTYFKFK